MSSTLPSWHIVGGGVLTIDIVQLCDSYFLPEQSTAFYAPGGTISNVLAYASALDESVQGFAVGAIGADDLGAAALRDLSTFGVNCDLVDKFAVPSRRILHLISRRTSGNRHLFSTRCTLCQRELPRFPPHSNAAVSNLLRLPSSKTALLIDRANEFAFQLATAVSTSAAVVFEPTRIGENDGPLRQLVHIARIVKVADDLPNRDRLIAVFDGEPHSEWKLLVETHGRQGISVRTQDRRISINIGAVPAVTVLDAAGAGDACTAGFLIGLASSLFSPRTPPTDVVHLAARQGQALGAIACTFYGARGPLYALCREELREALEATLEADCVPSLHRPSVPPTMSLPSVNPGTCDICRIPL